MSSIIKALWSEHKKLLFRLLREGFNKKSMSFRLTLYMLNLKSTNPFITKHLILGIFINPFIFFQMFINRSGNVVVFLTYITTIGVNTENLVNCMNWDRKWRKFTCDRKTSPQSRHVGNFFEAISRSDLLPIHCKLVVWYFDT